MVSFFLYVLDRFDALISKMILKKIKKHQFEKQPQPLPNRLMFRKKFGKMIPFCHMID